jgi:type II secretory pathway predicted ATPase ExeA
VVTRPRVAVQPPPDTLTYEHYFGLTEKAFSLSADSRFVYESPAYAATSASLLAGIRRREGLLVLTGQIGAGKTTLCRDVVNHLGRNTYRSLVPDPFASREDLLKMLLIDFGVSSIQDVTSGPLGQASRTALGYLLSEFLESLAADAFVVVVIDEAQNLSLPLIEETRLLSDTFGANGRLQIVLVGQPELHAKLQLPEMRQVDQRVCGYHRLGPLSDEAVGGYIQHRLTVAGGRPDRVLFPPEVVHNLHRRTGGVPRLINRVCDRALHLAYERRADSVDVELLDTALIELGPAMLSPTWDSIMFAEPPAPQPPPKAAPKVEPKVHIVEIAPSADASQDFKSEVEHPVTQVLAPPPLAPPPVPAHRIEESQTTSTPFDVAQGSPGRSRGAPEQSPAPRRHPTSERRPASRVVSGSSTGRDRARAERTDWSRDQQSESHVRRLGRLLAGAAIVVTTALTLYVAAMGVSLLVVASTPPELPAVPEAPPRAVAGLSQPDAPAEGSESISVAAFSARSVDAGEYVVAVGLFADDRADHIVDSLAQAGLPVMQRSLRVRQQQLQQVVLGPFLSRSAATAELQRLRQLGGYEDAAVIDSARDTLAQ